MTGLSPLRVPLGNRGKHEHLGAADDPACEEDLDQGLEKVERCACGVARFHSKLPAGIQTEFIYGSHLPLSRLPPAAGALAARKRGLFLLHAARVAAAVIAIAA